MVGSIELASRMLIRLSSTPIDGAMAWITAHWPIPADPYHCSSKHSTWGNGEWGFCARDLKLIVLRRACPLRAGAGKVDAIEIDRRILMVGQQSHQERRCGEPLARARVNPSYFGAPLA